MDEYKKIKRKINMLQHRHPNHCGHPTRTPLCQLVETSPARVRLQTVNERNPAPPGMYKAM